MVTNGRDVVSPNEFGPNPYDPQTSAEARDLLLWLAFRDVGLRDAERYWRRVGVWTREGGLSRQPPFPQSWCGAFFLAQLHAAGLTDWPWTFDPALDHWGFYWRLELTKDPKPADGCYFKKHQHHAIWVGDGSGRIINGNGKGGEVTVTRGKPDAFYSIAPLVERFDDVQA